MQPVPDADRSRRQLPRALALPRLRDRRREVDERASHVAMVAPDAPFADGERTFQ